MSWTSVSHSHSHGHFAHEAEKKPQETFGWKNGLFVGQVLFQKKTDKSLTFETAGNEPWKFVFPAVAEALSFEERLL